MDQNEVQDRKEFIEEMMRIQGEFMPMIEAFTPEGIIVLGCPMPPPGPEKTEYLFGLSLYLQGLRATRYVFISEAWTIECKEDQIRNRPRNLADAPDRKEIVNVQEVWDNKAHMITFDTIRDENGKFVELRERFNEIYERVKTMEEVEKGKISGDLINLIPIPTNIIETQGVQ
jgi:hypothetical protein